MPRINTANPNQKYTQPKRLYLKKCLIICATLGALYGCQYKPAKTAEFIISGYVFEREALVNAQVDIVDAAGNRYQTTTDAQGFYQISAEHLQLPVLANAVANKGNKAQCADNTRLRPICMASLLSLTSGHKSLSLNINPLSDRIVSDIAVSKGFAGPQQWVDAGVVGAVKAKDVDTAMQHFHAGFNTALAQQHIAKQDPTRYAAVDHKKWVPIFSLLHHNRNYDNNTGGTGHTTLTDFSFRPIVGLMPGGAYEAFDMQAAQREYQQVQTAKIRIFIVGDSTSAVYEQLRYPRMGWGQAFAASIKPGSDLAVIVGSRAGRSSRDFYHGRWFAQMEYLIRPGDYVFINHGHNDQNCDSNKPLRGLADVNNLCTYPNDIHGKPQFPAGKPELSFQHSLERYIKIARKLGAQPILFTPTARIKNAKGQQTIPVVHTHFTRQGSNRNYVFTGNYSDTIKTTAELHNLPLINLEAATMALANQAGEPGWKQYWLVVDPAVNSFYANGVAGSTQLPDGTHFQKDGAEAIAAWVSNAIQQHPQLLGLAKYLK